MKYLKELLLVPFLLVLAPTAIAWDSVGHRITAAVAYEYLSADTRSRLIRILQSHPRYAEDFLGEMPAFVDRDDEVELQTWLLGQAAFWPDMARGLPDSARTRYNRPAWHFTDGAWVRDAARLQGNVYVDLGPFADITGTPATEIRSQRDVNNVVTALDYNARLLAAADTDPASRALALCWVLHLVGDIHQPLHTGSAFSRSRLRDGDRGGNAIPTNDGNLHARWDSALRAQGVRAGTEHILASLDGNAEASGTSMDWTRWLSDSRLLLHSAVYSPEILAAIRRAEQQGNAIAAVDLGPDYMEQMQRLAQQQLGLAGLRLATWFKNELN